MRTIYIRLIAYLKAEMTLKRKSRTFMKKIYKNRINANLKGEREFVVFAIDKMSETYYSNKLSVEYIEKLLYGFYFMTWKKELDRAILETIKQRKEELKKPS